MAAISIQIRPYQSADSNAIADLFHGSVHAISSKVYSEQQKEAWAPTPPDYQSWSNRLEDKRPLVAVHAADTAVAAHNTHADDSIIGFLELESSGHIDCLYVHKDYHRCGVGNQLLSYAMSLARELGITELYTEASKMARPLFEKAGFEYRRTNVVVLRGQRLENYSMRLML